MTMRKLIFSAAVATMLAALGGGTIDAKVACDRACLTGFVDTYYKALVGNHASEVPLTPGAKITLNGQAMKLDQAFWDSAERTVYRWDIVNEQLGDVASEAVVLNADSSKTMYMVRLKVLGGKITEVETIKANKGEADRLWDPDNLTAVSPALQLSIREADQDSYYGLIAAAESYWRAFQTNGTEAYHPASLMPDASRDHRPRPQRRLGVGVGRLRQRPLQGTEPLGSALPGRRHRARHRAVDRAIRLEGRNEKRERGHRK
jgi:hypothetical protein